MAFQLPPLPTTALRVLGDSTMPSACNEGFVRLRRQLELIRAGELEDAKTQIALRRLGDVE